MNANPVRIRVLIGLIVGLVIASGANAAEPRRPELPPLKILTPHVRERLDRLADSTSLESTAQETVNIAGNVTAWAMTQVTLTPEEEVTFASTVNKQIVKEAKVLETPKEVDELFTRLLAEVPPHLKPPFRYSLAVLDIPMINAFTIGGGYVYITKPLLNAFLETEDGSRDALALILAHELGHIGRLHCRRGYQLIQHMMDLENGLPIKIDLRLLKKIYETAVAPVGNYARFLYTRDQEYECDYFGLQLCRAARVDLAKSLDAMRWFIVVSYPRLLKEDRYAPAPGEGTLLDYYLTSHPDPILRLKRLRAELTGAVNDEADFGLFVFDRTGNELRRKASDRAGVDGAASIVFVHGVQGERKGFDDFAHFFAEQKKTSEHRLYIFRYPSSNSIIRTAHFLQRECVRVFGTEAKPIFVCHGSGGLVFRYYAERKKGNFARVVFLSTPHGGCDLVSLRLLLSAAELVGDFKGGPFEVVNRTIPAARSDLGFDLQADSFFLRHLGENEALARRYYTIAGRCLGTTESLFLRTTLTSARQFLRTQLTTVLPAGSLRERAVRLIDRLELPREVSAGDGIVAVQSAQLPGGGGQRVFDGVNHLTLRTNPEVMEVVLPWVVGE